LTINTIIKKDYTYYWLSAGLILTLIVYLPSFTNGFTNWDDPEYINNLYVNNLSLAGIVKIFSVYFIGNYHPLTLLSLGIDRLIGGDNPFIFHFTNLLLHLLNTFLVFLLVKRLTQNNLLALLTFVLFGVHTLHVESVAWVSERKDVLYSFFFLLSLVIYTTYASGRKSIYYWLSFLFFLLSILAKGQAVVLVVILPLIDYVKGRKWFSPKVLSEKIPFLLLSLIFGWIAIRAQESANAINVNYFTLPERFAFASFGLAQYLIKSLVPLGLSAYYPFPPRLINGGIPSFYWFYIISFPVFFMGSYLLFKRSKIYAFGISMFFLTLLPLLQLIPVGGAIMADRYFYIPSVGLMLCFAVGLLEIRNTTFRYALIILFILVLSSLSFSRCMVWKGSMTLWDDVISKYEYADVAHFDRGFVYADLGQWDKAIADYSKALEIDPNFADGYFDRGIAYGALGEWNKAIDDYSKAIEINPKYTNAYDNRGVAWVKLGQWDKAIADYSMAIESDPEYTKAYDQRAFAYGNLEQWDKAIADYTRAIEGNPKYPDTYDDRGIAYGHLGQFDKAIADFSSVIAIDPNFTKAYCNRGVAYGSLGQWDKAIADFSSAIGIDPKYTDAYDFRGVAYINLGQYNKALADFSRAIEIDPNFTKAYYDREFAYRKLNSEKKR
jgi:tetratricopeptide (TPR) repeat protein